MTYELKENTNTPDLLAPSIVEAQESVIYRKDVENGGTFRVQVISQAMVGDMLSVRLEAFGVWSSDIVFNEVNLGKPLDFKVQYRSFSQGDLALASYKLLRGPVVIGQSPTSVYELKD